MSKVLRNLKHERFVRAIVLDGMDPAEAYVDAGFVRARANHFRLMRHPRVAARIAELKQARGARTPAKDVLVELGQRGIVRVADFFESGPTGLVVRDLRFVRVDVALALLISLREGFAISETGEVVDDGSGGPPP
jgi:hypothetical protein